MLVLFSSVQFYSVLSCSVLSSLGSVPVLFSRLSCSLFYSFYSFYWALVLSPLLSYSYCSCCYSLHRSSLYSSSSRRYCLHLRGLSSVPYSRVFFSSTSSPSSIVELAADVSSSSAPSSNLWVYSGSLSSEAPHFFTNTCPSGLFSSSPSWLLWFLKYSSAHPSVRRFGSLSLVAPTAILIKLFFQLSLSVCWVRVWVCGSLFSFSLCSSLLLYRLNLAGHARSFFLHFQGRNLQPSFCSLAHFGLPFMPCTSQSCHFCSQCCCSDRLFKETNRIVHRTHFWKVHRC